VLPHFVSGALVRVVPDWYADLGKLSLYHSSRTLPAKTRVFIDFIAEQFQKQRLARRFSAV
jgi:DNA-binding transcriptional LysR family regulator